MGIVFFLYSLLQKENYAYRGMTLIIDVWSYRIELISGELLLDLERKDVAESYRRKVEWSGIKYRTSMVAQYRRVALLSPKHRYLACRGSSISDTSRCQQPDNEVENHFPRSCSAKLSHTRLYLMILQIVPRWFDSELCSIAVSDPPSSSWLSSFSRFDTKHM